MKRNSIVALLASLATVCIWVFSSVEQISATARPTGIRGTRPGDLCTEACREVDRYLTRLIKEDGPGVAVLVMKGDEPVLMKGYGKARIADAANGIAAEDITTDTVFDLASVSKQFTAVGILMLVDRSTKTGPDDGKYGKLSLDDKLATFFPNLPGAKDITIRHLLTHSSGLPEYMPLKRKEEHYYCCELESTGFWYARMQQTSPPYMTNKETIRLVETQQKPDFEPGSKFCYSNTGYVVLAEIIRKLTNKSLCDFLREEVFVRLKMNDTFVFDEKNRGFDRHALCYRATRDGRGQLEYESIGSDTEFNYIHGDGNVHSTIADMAKWQLALNRVNDAPEGDPEALIKRETFFSVFDPLKLLKSAGLAKKYFVYDRRQSKKYGSGFFLYSYQKGRVRSFALHHGGEWLGFHSYLMRGDVRWGKSERVSMSIVVLSNFHSTAPINKPCGSSNNARDPCYVATRLSKIYWQLGWMPKRWNVFRYLCTLGLPSSFC
jgi:CubicO group peptidase (beta-lactamase class C family)